MVVFNTTFSIDKDIHQEFMDFLLESFIPLAMESGILTLPRLSKIVSHGEDEGVSLALEFQAEDFDALEDWQNNESADVFSRLIDAFGDKVVGFSTFMEVIS